MAFGGGLVEVQGVWGAALKTRMGRAGRLAQSYLSVHLSMTHSTEDPRAPLLCGDR